MLPVGPPGYGESPYSAQSAFAGNPSFVSPEDLGPEGGLDEAFDRWRARGKDSGYLRFCKRAGGWLDDFALFRALKRAHGGVQWTLWERGTKKRDPKALSSARRELARDIAFEKFVQYAFDTQWSALRKYAKERGVALIGDIPLVVAHDSADVWQHAELFFLDEAGEPTSVAGVPPDYFSATGQRWARSRQYSRRGASSSSVASFAGNGASPSTRGNGRSPVSSTSSQRTCPTVM